jgi:hypothetical protein
MKLALPDIVLGLDGRFYASSAALPLAQRIGRRVLRVVELTPAEEQEVRSRLSDAAAETLAALAVKRGGAR